MFAPGVWAMRTVRRWRGSTAPYSWRPAPRTAATSSTPWSCWPGRCAPARTSRSQHPHSPSFFLPLLQMTPPTGADISPEDPRRLDQEELLLLLLPQIQHQMIQTNPGTSRFPYLYSFPPKYNSKLVHSL